MELGQSPGWVFLAVFWRASDSTLITVALAGLATMLGIYIGAHLVSGDLPRIIYEALFFIGIMGIALLFRERWPIGLAMLTLGHAVYDFLFGHASGVASWYPEVCMGYDLIVGSGLIFRLLRCDPRSE